MDNAETKAKNTLGRKWAEKCGTNFKYVMVFEKKKVDNTYTPDSIMEVLKGL